MKAAVAAKQDPALVIAGRTSACAIAGLDEAVKRAKAYEACGVDALFFVGAKTRAEVDAISAATTLPLILGGATAGAGGQRLSLRPPRPHRLARDISRLWPAFRPCTRR